MGVLLSTFLGFLLYLISLVKSSENPSVIIVGAGASGISAATRLLENGINNITILEAENRIGGRIHSVKIGDGYVDLGAEFCHGQEGNVVYNMAKNFDLLDGRVNFLEHGIYYSNGSKLDKELTTDLRRFFAYYIEKPDNYDTRGKSIGDLASYRFNTTLLKKYENDLDRLKILKDGLRYVEGLILTAEGSFTWLSPSVEDPDYEECPGHQNLIWKGTGYRIVLELLMKNYPDPKQKLPIDDKVRLNTEVNKIKWNQNKPTVFTSDGVSFEADYVIFTPSVGVLQQQKDSLFEPKLPTIKQSAIESIGLEGIVKVAIHFSEKWWEDKDNIIVFFWSEEDLKNIEFSEGPSINGVSWVGNIRGIIRINFLSNVWITWVSGELTPEIEKLTPDTLKSGIKYVLDKFLHRDFKITEIDKIISSKWINNTHFRGSWSFLRTGMYQKGVSHQRNLGEPLKNEQNRTTLLFAGEATNPIHHSTVHGAIETGFREADRIIRLTAE